MLCVAVLGQWEEFMELSLDDSEEELDDIISSQRANQCCVLIYTSGTTGQPKGVMLSHDNVSFPVAIVKFLLRVRCKYNKGVCKKLQKQKKVKQGFCFYDDLFRSHGLPIMPAGSGTCSQPTLNRSH